MSVVTFRSSTVFYFFIFCGGGGEVGGGIAGIWPCVLALDSLSHLTAEPGRAGGAERERREKTAPCKYFMAIGQQDVNVVFLLCCDFPAKVSPVTD